MQLVITDSSAKTAVLRSAFPGAQITVVEFPLYTRFSRTAKIKVDSWPKLKPTAKGKIENLIKQASKGTRVIAVLDNSAYGRTQARDIKEALGAVNAQVSFLFPDLLERDEIRTCDNSDIIEEPDAKYVADRIVTQRLNAVLADVFPVNADIELTRQQAYVLSSVYGSAADCTSVSYTDSAGRQWHGKPGKLTDASTTVSHHVLSHNQFPVYGCPSVGLERLWNGMDKLQAMGLIPTHECEMSDVAFSRWCTYISEVAGLTPKAIKPKCKTFWVDDPSFQPANIVDELAARPLFKWLRNQTMMLCLAEAKIIKIHGEAGPISCDAYLEKHRQWAMLKDMQSSEEYEYSKPQHDLVLLDPKFVSATTIHEDCEGLLTQRETWSALLYLHRNNFIKRYNSTFYPTSRGVIAVMALKQVFPIALSKNLTDLVNDAVAEPDLPTRTLMLNAAFEENHTAHDITMWDAFTRGKAILSVSKSSAFFLPGGSSDESKSAFGLALADGLPRVIRPNTALSLNCKCGCTVVKTLLDSSYEPQFICESCNKTYSITTLKQMEI